MDTFEDGIVVGIIFCIMALIGACIDSWVINTDCKNYGMSTIGFKTFECKLIDKRDIK